MNLHSDETNEGDDNVLTYLNGSYSRKGLTDGTLIGLSDAQGKPSAWYEYPISYSWR